MTKPHAWIVYLSVLLATSLAQGQAPRATPLPAAENSLKQFLRDYVRQRDRKSFDDKTIRYFHSFIDLNGDGTKEAIVYIVGRAWCGSGGCNTLILARSGASWRVVKTIMITRPPIRVLASTSHGWHSITVGVAGGGIAEAYEAELRFDRRSYPGNPTVPS